MSTVHMRPFISTFEHAGSSMRSDRLLRGMHKVFSHDLPNQMVALQSLLQLLHAEEAERLSAEGQEYVRRLQNVTQRACEQVRFLKEMGRMKSYMAKSETISLVTLSRELQGELQQKHPHRSFAFDWRWSVPTIVGDARTILLALSELFAGFLHPSGTRCRLSANATRHGGAIELAFHLEQVISLKAEDTVPTGLRWTAQNLDQRMEIILAREWLALSGADLDVTLPEDGEVRFSIAIPNR